MTSQPGKKIEQVHKIKRAPGAEMYLSAPHMKHDRASLYSAKAHLSKTGRNLSLTYLLNSCVRSERCERPDTVVLQGYVLLTSYRV